MESEAIDYYWQLRGNRRPTGIAKPVGGKHERPIERYIVPSGRWRQRAEPQTRTKARQLHTRRMETDRKNAKDGTSTGIQCHNTGQLEDSWVR